MKYLIEIDEKQLQSLSMACETVTRLSMGQFDVLNNITEDCIPWDDTKLIEQMVFPDGNTKGIRNKEIPDKFRQLWDLYQVMRKCISEKQYNDAPADNKPSRMGCHFDNPMKTSRECELPMIAEKPNIQVIGRSLRKPLMDVNIEDIKDNVMIIKKIHEDHGVVQLQVICPECEKYIMIDEDCGFCPMCFKEIESTNIKAWTEYEHFHKHKNSLVKCSEIRKANEIAKELLAMPPKELVISVDVSTCDADADHRVHTGEYFDINDIEDENEVVLLFSGTPNFTMAGKNGMLL